MIEHFYYSSFLFKATLLLYFVAMLCYIMVFINKKELWQKTAKYIFTVAFVVCTVLIIDRWIEAGRPPFKSLYESLIFASWTISLVNLFVEYRLKVRLLGSITSIGVVIIFLYALSKRDVEIIALPPALQTWLFIPHVIAYFLAYGALFVAAMSAILYLIKPGGIQGHRAISDDQNIDFSKYTYAITKFGFLFLTIGLLLGSWWGQSAWSNYWGWDPKENWALISWLIFAAYLHFRNIKSWSEKRLAWVVIVGCVAIAFTYLGMDYLPTAEDSLHIYVED